MTHTERSRKTSREQFTAWAGKQPEQATRADIEAYLDHMKQSGLSASTIRVRLSNLAYGHPDPQIFRRLDVPARRNSIESYKAWPAMEPDEFRRIEALIPADDIETRLMWYAMGLEGLRVGDMLAMKWEDFGWPWMNGATLLYRELWRQKAQTSDGRVFTLKGRSGVIKRLSKYWPEVHHLHGLRKHAARKWNTEKVHFLKTKRRLDHKIDREMTNIYTGIEVDE